LGVELLVSIGLWTVLGLLVGTGAKFMMGGDDSDGLIQTLVLGIVGSNVGGAIAMKLGLGGLLGFNLESLGISLGISILGGMAVLAFFRW
jgi:uncharacterized membrane protein YeaQ/YmgE (transglycosylase-associated protein family)